MREPERLSPSRAFALPVKPMPSSETLYLLQTDTVSRAASGTTGQEEAPRRGWPRVALTAALLAALWGGLAGWEPASWVFGGPVVVAATAVAFRFAPTPAWRLSVPGAVRFAVWFWINALRGGLDVAGRALGWQVALRPGFRTYRTSLPPGPARICFANTISLLPGTLSAEVAGDRIEVHMLDTGTDLEAELADLEARVRALFALPAPAPTSVQTEDMP